MSDKEKKFWEFKSEMCSDFLVFHIVFEDGRKLSIYFHNVTADEKGMYFNGTGQWDENHLFKSRPKDAPGVEFFPWETVKDMYTTDEGFYSIRD